VTDPVVPPVPVVDPTVVVVPPTVVEPPVVVVGAGVGVVTAVMADRA